MIRSYLFVPGDRPDLMRKALNSGADALILDLEDSVTPGAKDAARDHVQGFLAGLPDAGPRMFVRINPLSTSWASRDAAMVAVSKAYGIVLPKAESGECLRKLLTLLQGAPLKVMPIVTETPRAVFGTGTYAGISSSLHALTWGAEDLSSAVGATRIKDDSGRYTPPYEMARSLTLFGAMTAEVEAVETVYPAFRDVDGLRDYARRGREDGFTGMMAIHPAQVAVINEAFAVTTDEVDEARRIVALFKDNPGAGALSLDGKMVDAPHLAKARRLIDRI